MNKNNNKVLEDISYGLYVLTTRDEEKDNGCIINVAAQVTDNPLQILITVNKHNYTHDIITKTREFNLNILTEKTPMLVFENFGFQSGKDVDKFAKCEVQLRSTNGILYLPRYSNGYISGKVTNMVDLNTHTLFIAEVTESVKLSEDKSLTYTYYHDHIKPKPQIKGNPGNPEEGIWVCKTCGYIYEGKEVPEDYICPWCKHGKNDFYKKND